MSKERSAAKSSGSREGQPSCKAKAVEFLARSDQSIRRLSDKLSRKGYGEDEIEETIQWLQSKRFIQEEEGCRRRFEFLYHDSSYSVRQIVAKLQQQGYDRDMIRECTMRLPSIRPSLIASLICSCVYSLGLSV